MTLVLKRGDVAAPARLVKLSTTLNCLLHLNTPKLRGHNGARQRLAPALARKLGAPHMVLAILPSS